jgi:hypothetical protein
MRDPYFALIKSRLPDLLKPETFIGNAQKEVGEFVRGVLEPALTDESFQEPKTRQKLARDKALDTFAQRIGRAAQAASA